MAKQLDILIADDEALNMLALTAQLETLGHRVAATARDGLQAVEAVRATPVDLAILDIRMPNLNGLDAAREIVRLRPTPIILLTGYNDPDNAIQAGVAPIFHFLLKPITLEELAPAIGVARSRFEDWQRLRDDVERLSRKLEERELVQQAKAALMQLRDLSEADAYRLMQKESQKQSRSMGEIARTILDAEVLLRDVTQP